MMRFICQCDSFAIRPESVEANSASDAALAFAQRWLPGPDRWGQTREVEYVIRVTDPDGEEAQETVHACETVLWGKGPIL